MQTLRRQRRETMLDLTGVNFCVINSHSEYLGEECDRICMTVREILRSA